MPKVVEAIKSRVDILSQSKKLPAGMTAEKLAEAKAGLNGDHAAVDGGDCGINGGNLMDAVAKATAR